MTLVKLELRVRDWYVLNPFTAFVHVTSNRLFKTFHSYQEYALAYKRWKTASIQ
jgi:hypothetical protein